MKFRNLLIIIISVLFVYAKVNAQQSGVNYRITNYSSSMPNINAGDSSAVEVYPNPAKTEVNIYINSLLQEQKGELIIYNNSGAAVAQKVVGFGNNQIYLGDIANGYYTIRIIRDNGIATTTKLLVAK